MHTATRLAPAVALLVGGALATAPAATAQDVKLPQTLTFTAYDTGTSGFNIAVAVGKVFKDRYNTDVRVLPAGNDVARLAPIRGGQGAGVGDGHRRVFRPGGRARVRYPRMGPAGSPDPAELAGLQRRQPRHRQGCRRTELKDLKGKRVGFVVGAPSLNQNSLASLGLRRPHPQRCDDRGILQLRRDVEGHDHQRRRRGVRLHASRAQTKEVETSPRGLVWPTWPHSDKAGWERVRKIAPFLQSARRDLRARAGLSAQAPKEMGGFPYPIFTRLRVAARPGSPTRSPRP